MNIITTNNVSKVFHLKLNSKMNALGHIINFFSLKNKTRELWALKNISFTVNSGEVIGLVGNNSSGKSTLLRIIADIYKPDSGAITVSGKTISIIDLYSGLNPRLSMLDNIFLSCSLYGLTLPTIKKQLDKIIQFAELENYIYEPLYKFSSGMLERLIFSIAVHSITDSDINILLLDEVLAVGDINFVKKSLDKLKEIFGQGLTIIMASHDLNEIIPRCQRVIWLDQGQIVKDGPCADVLIAYKNTLKY